MLRTIPVALVLSVAVSAGGSATQESGTAAIVESYLAVQSRLAADSLEGVGAEAARIAAEAERLGAGGEALKTAAVALRNAADLKAARAAFGSLSDAVVARVRADQAFDPGPELRLGYCPMVKRSWVQRDAQVRNPYYGKQMLTCGELKPIR